MTVLFFAKNEIDLSEWDSITSVPGATPEHATPGLNSTLGKISCLSNASVFVTKELTPFPNEELSLDFYFLVTFAGGFSAATSQLARIFYDDGNLFCDITLQMLIVPTSLSLFIRLYGKDGVVQSSSVSIVTATEYHIQAGFSDKGGSLYLDGVFVDYISANMTTGLLEQLDIGTMGTTLGALATPYFFDEVRVVDDFSELPDTILEPDPVVLTIFPIVPEITADVLTYKVNDIEICGVQSLWAEVIVRTNPNGTKAYSTWALNRWSIPITTQEVWEGLELVEGESIILATNRYDNRNSQASYTDAIFMGVANQLQVGLPATNINIEFRVKVA